MIPPFNDDGYLPPGVHLATIEEVEKRFGHASKSHASEIRQAQVESLKWLLHLAREAKIQRLVINGSFVTEALEPNDVDCALLAGSDFAHDSTAATELEQGLPFLEIKIVEEADFALFLGILFASDRYQVQKGMVELRLWN